MTKQITSDEIEDVPADATNTATEFAKADLRAGRGDREGSQRKGRKPGRRHPESTGR